MLTLAKYFIDFKKYSESWEILTKKNIQKNLTIT